MSDELKLTMVRERLESDPLSADLQWSLLVAALSSYRYDTILRPYPPMYLLQRSDTVPDANGSAASADNRQTFPGVLSENRDNEALKRDVLRIPNFRSNELTTLDGKLLDLILWTINTKQFTLKTCSSNKFDEIKTLTGHTTPIASPHFVFQVVHSPSADEKFDAIRKNRDVMWAYHGSRLENFHSIIHYGLQGHLNKNSVFGEGTYLSSELSVSLQYSPVGLSWQMSNVGNQLSCIAVCEIIDDPSVKCQMQESRGTTRSIGSRSRIADSIGGEVPEKYYVVQNNDVVRVRYLLVYAEKNSPPPQRRIARFLQRYKFIIVVGFYVVLLFLLGVVKSPKFQSYVKRFSSSS